MDKQLPDLYPQLKTGVCLQFDVLDDCMTTVEHMQLVGAIKGLHPADTAIEVRFFSKLDPIKQNKTRTSHVNVKSQAWSSTTWKFTSLVQTFFLLAQSLCKV